MPPAAFQVLPDQGLLLLEGAEALAFLQGQVTADLRGLEPGRAVLAALCSAQGRVIAVVRIGHIARGLAVVLPRELAAPVADRLRRFVLRARVAVHDASGEFAVIGLGAGGASFDPARGDWTVLLLDSARRLAIGPADALPAPVAAVTSPEWDALGVALGEPQVVAATAEAWVPQMLNLDLLGGLSLGKGCYIGQEVVARLHYLGRSKRRMFRYAYSGTGEPAAGSSLFHAGTEVGQVVRRAGGPGTGELLAVVDTGSAGLALADAAGQVTCTPLPLPYSVPRTARPA